MISERRADHPGFGHDQARRLVADEYHAAADSVAGVAGME